MKKVLLEKDVISIDSIDNNSHIGIQWKGGNRGIIVKSIGQYMILNLNSNGLLGGCSSSSKKQYILDRINNGDVKDVFVFESFEKLLIWFNSKEI